MATVTMDAMDPKSKGLAKLLKKNNVKMEILTMRGPSGWPEVELTGKREDLETVLADGEYGWDDPELAEYIEEGANVNEAKIILKRRYTENHPAVTVGKAARIRNKMLEAIADGVLTEEEFNNILSEYSANAKQWMKRNARFFNVSEKGIALSKFGKKALSAVVVNEEEPVTESASELKKLEDAIKMFQDKIKGQGRVTNARDEEHLENLIKIYKEMGGKNIKESFVKEGKFKVDDLVYNTRTKTVGIVRMGDDKYGEVKTDADGNVDVDELEKYNPIKFKHQTKAKVAPSTEREVNKRGLFNPFKIEESTVDVEEGRKFVAAAKKAKDAGDEEFEFNGKKFPVTIKEGNAFSAARAKAIADGKKEFTVGGETYPVEDVDKEDKENAEEFAAESFVYESFSSFVESLNEKKPSSSDFNGPGLIVIPNSKKDSDLIDQVAEEEGLYGIENYKEGYWFFPEERGQQTDNLEIQLEDALIKKGADVRYEAQYEAKSLNEAFKSMKLAQLLTPKKKSSWNKGIAQEFYNYAKVKLDQIEDHDLLEVDPQVAYKQKGGTKVKFFLIDNEKQSPYVEDSYDGRVPAGIIAVMNGNNDFMGSVWQRYGGDKGRTLKVTDKGDSLGANKKRKGYGATGLSSAKRIADFADRAIVIDIDILRQRYSAEQQRAERAAAQKGAIAFKSDKEFKAENEARYREILANKAAALPLDKMVNDAIDKLAAQIKEGLAKGEKTKYGDIKIGENKRGNPVKMRDASNHMNNILDYYDRYVNYVGQIEKETAEWGRANSYYDRESKKMAKKVKDAINKIDTFDYAW